MKEELEITNEDSVFIKRRIRFAKKAFEEMVKDDTASSDEHLAVTTRECNDNPGGGVANHNTWMWMWRPARMPASLPVMRQSLTWLTTIGVNEKELKVKVTPDMGKDLKEEKLEDLVDIQIPRVFIVNAREDSRDIVEDPEIPSAGGEEVPECTKNKIDEAKSNDG